MEVSCKENTSIAKVIERAKPTFVTIGNKQIISSGRWNNELMADYVFVHGREKWLGVGDLARTAYGQNTPRSKERVRRCLPQLFKALMATRTELLVVEYGPPHNRARAVKLFDRQSEVDRQNLKIKLERMKKRRELTAEQYERALVVLQEKETAPS
jgi:hypothetical protein